VSTIEPVQPEPMLQAAWRVRTGNAGSPPSLADYAARAIAPANPARKDVTEMKAALRHKYPEFF